METYITYRITSPEGKSYIGSTKVKLNTRVKQHFRRAKSFPEHPFYQAILKYGSETFTFEVIEEVSTKEESKASEIKHIAQDGLENLYNISPGGDFDSATGRKVFWERLNSSPDKRKQYIAKLCVAQQNRGSEAHAHLPLRGAKWAKDNPKEAYKISMRNLRLANRGKVKTAKEERSLKERLLLKHKRISLRWGKAARKVWASRTQGQIACLAEKISNTLKAQYSKNEDLKSKNEKQLTEARKNIDRPKQVSAAREGISKYWADLRSDPEKYAQYKLKKVEATQKCRETMLRKKEIKND